jgi:hypothetical protein
LIENGAALENSLFFRAAFIWNNQKTFVHQDLSSSDPKSVLYSDRSEKSKIVWEIVLVTLNDKPDVIGRAFLLGSFI